MKRTRTAIELMLIVWFAAFAIGQTAPTVHQTATRSSCSNIVALSGAKVDCSNLTPAQKKALENIPAILKMALANQDYLDSIMAKLNEMSKAQAQSSSNSVVGNVVTGNQNILGNNNQLNVGAFPPRHVPANENKELTDFLAAYPSKVSVYYPANDGEAFNYAMEIVAILKAAGWTVNGPAGVMTISNIPLYGSAVVYRGEKVEPNAQVTLDPGKAWGHLARAMSYLQGGDLYAEPGPDMPEDEIRLQIYTNPKAKPQ